MKIPAPSPFDGIQPCDGYVVTTHSSQSEGIRINVELVSLGSSMRNVDVYTNNAPRNEDIGVAGRLHRVLDAICQYFNCGGSWDELNAVLEAAGSVILGGLQFEGWVYLDSCEDEDGLVVKWVEDATGRIAAWTRDVCIDTDCGNINGGVDDSDFVYVQPEGDGRNS